MPMIASKVPNIRALRVYRQVLPQIPPKQPLFLPNSLQSTRRLCVAGSRWICQNTPMPTQINRVSGYVIIVLSLTALLAVLSGYTHPVQSDEGAAAHIFQLSIVALVPLILLFLITADWRQPLRSARPLALSGTALVFAFGALYYLEHYR